MREDRIDFGEITSRADAVDGDGFLRASARFTRSGIFTYRTPSGVRREWRPPEEVGAPRSVASLSMVPVAQRHPAGGVIRADNARALAVGSTGSEIRFDGEFLIGPIVIFDSGAVAGVRNGSAAELSAGYTCRLDMTPGIVDGQPYDAIQREIVYNHVALEPEGRAGPLVRVLDGAQVWRDDGDAESVACRGLATQSALDNAGSSLQRASETGAPGAKRGSMIKLRIDGVDCEITEASAPLVQSKIDAIVLTAKSAGDERSRIEARADAADGKAAAAEVAKAAEFARGVAAGRARASLEATAAEFGVDVRTDATDAEIKSAIVVKIAPDVRLDGKAEAYVDAAMDLQVDAARKARGSERRLDGVAAGLAGSASAPAPDAWSESLARVRKIRENWG
jgi:uncharacterized protein